MAKNSIAHQPTHVVVGVDTHNDIHVARAKDQLGRRLGERIVPATTAGYQDLLAWARGHGEVDAWGVEGTGSFGAGLARYLLARDQVVIEVIRPNRQHRHHRGKSDPADADAAASAVISGDARGLPKEGTGMIEMIRTLRIARSSALKARTQASNALKALVVTAPAELRESLRGLRRRKLMRTCARLRPGTLDDPVAATKMALRTLACRYESLEAEVKALDAALGPLVAKAAPELVALFGVGPESAGALLVAAGDNPQRLRSEAAFSMLCGSSSLEASSGKVKRHRLNRGGDRQANAALHRVVVVRLRWDKATREYMDRRTKQGKTKPKVMRCLKRYVAREVYQVFTAMEHKSASSAA